MIHAMLVCEGACNPTLPALDARAAEERGSDRCAVSLGLASDLRSLVHRPHTFVGRKFCTETTGHREPTKQVRQVWGCTVCQTERIWG